MDTNRQQHSKPIPAHVHHHLTALQQSGKTIAAYCREAGVSAWSIYDWKKRYGQKLSASPGTTMSPLQLESPPILFTELGTLVQPNRSTPRFEIRLPGGTSIGVYEGTSVEELAPFLPLLNGRAIVC